jgi:integrase
MRKTTTIKVKLRQKKISGQRTSLYLDFYPAIYKETTGSSSRREFLGMYLHEKPKSPLDKQHNKEVEFLAQGIRQRREIELNKDEVYGLLERKAIAEQRAEEERGNQDFLDYFRNLADKRKSSNYDNWICALHFLESYSNGTVKVSDLTERWCNGFREYLSQAKSKNRKTKLSVNTTVSYFNKFKAALKQAYKDGLLTIDLNSRVEQIKSSESQRQFLSIEELNKLVKTECAIPLIKNAALFSALTGLRHSDIQKLLWSEVGYSKEIGHYLQFRQKKTGGAEMLPISVQAYNLLGERRNDSDKVFEGLTYSGYHNRYLYNWLGAAGITKHITFHCFRHTYATLLLSNGADMATVSKMLGHRDLKTTQIYAKVVDESKRKAANMIKLDL